jgi:hypothetical protein
MTNFATTVTEAMHLRINGDALPLARLLQAVAGALAGADLPSTDLASLVSGRGSPCHGHAGGQSSASWSRRSRRLCEFRLWRAACAIHHGL